MPSKTCVVCQADYWARWRNTPAVCDTCAGRVLICPGCWHVEAYSDPAQLSLFGARALEPFGLTPLAQLVAQHFAHRVPLNFEPETHVDDLLTTEAAQHPEPTRHHWPRRATHAERMKYPFH